MSWSLPVMFFPAIWKQPNPWAWASFCIALGSTGFGRNQTPPRFASSRDSSTSSAMDFSLFADAPETVVVVIGVVELASLAHHDTPCAASPLAGGLHRVLAVVAAGLLRQQALAIAEHRAILRIGKRPALADE